MLSLTQGALGLASGSLVGFSLGLVGGGGSILAVPLLVYLVGVSDPHAAIGTSAIAVAANAAANLANHARAGNVKWRCASVFAAAGVAGAFLGSTRQDRRGPEAARIVRHCHDGGGCADAKGPLRRGRAVGAAEPGESAEALRHGARRGAFHLPGDVFGLESGAAHRLAAE